MHAYLNLTGVSYLDPFHPFRRRLSAPYPAPLGLVVLFVPLSVWPRVS